MPLAIARATSAARILRRCQSGLEVAESEAGNLDILAAHKDGLIACKPVAPGKLRYSLTLAGQAALESLDREREAETKP